VVARPLRVVLCRPVLHLKPVALVERRLLLALNQGLPLPLDQLREKVADLQTLVDRGARLVAALVAMLRPVLQAGQ
jgi:hypothetical protein